MIKEIDAFQPYCFKNGKGRIRFKLVDSTTIHTTDLLEAHSMASILSVLSGGTPVYDTEKQIFISHSKISPFSTTENLPDDVSEFTNQLSNQASV